MISTLINVKNIDITKINIGCIAIFLEINSVLVQ